MSKHLRIWLFALLGTLLTSTSLLAQGVITMTIYKPAGETIKLRIEANGNFTIEGAQETSRETVDGTGRKYYILKSQTITIRGDVTKLVCYKNQLTSLDVSKNTALKWLSCGENPLTSLDVSKNTALTTLACDDNQLTSLDVSKNTALKVLSCGSNQLTSLDLSKNPALTDLYCGDNQLTSLDLSKNPALTDLYCGDNNLTNLNISGCARLKTLSCSGNSINGKAMTKLVNSLPNRRGKSFGWFAVIGPSPKKRGENRCSATDVTTARRKNWRIP